MLQVLPCPQCGKHALIPSQTSLEATIRCPSCHSQLVLGEALLTQFNNWEVLDDPAEKFDPVPRKLNPGVIVPVPADDGQLALVAELETPTPRRSSSTSASRSSNGLPEYDKRRRKQKSPLWSLVPILLGGLVSFPIAMLIIWHVLGRDVADLGPKVAEFAPWIVPEKFHPMGQPSNSDQLRPDLRPNQARGNRNTPERGSSGFRQFDDVMPQPKLAPDVDSSVASDVEANNQSSSTDKAAQKKPTIEMPQTVENLNANEPQPLRAEIAASPTVDDNPSDATGSNVFASIREAQQSLKNLELAMKIESTDRAEKLATAHSQLSALAVTFNTIDHRSPVWRAIKEQTLPLAKQTISNADMLDKLEKYTRRLIGKSDDSVGVISSLEISSCEPLDSVWMASGKHVLPETTVIEVPRVLAPQLSAGQQYLVLGVYQPTKSGENPASPPQFRVSCLFPKQ